MRRFARMLLDERGVTMSEYAIIITLLSVSCMAILVAIANTSNTSLSSVASQTQAYQVATPP